MITPTQQLRQISYRKPPPLLKGLDAAVHGLAGIYRRRSGSMAALQRLADSIDREAATWQSMADYELHVRLMDAREAFRRNPNECDDALLIFALAAIREAARRKLGLKPFPVQLVGALALHRGYLAEMATGEGKTLTAGLAAVLTGWTRRPCQVITVNDYLVQRDADWMHPLFTFCGIRVGSVTASMDQVERQRGYAADVTYVTSKELLADFLRDRLRLGVVREPSRRLLQEVLHPRSRRMSGIVMRGLHTAIVDEADSVLIDEAVTPLIISAPRENPLLRESIGIAQEIAGRLRAREDYLPNQRYREVELTRSGRDRLKNFCSDLPGFWQGEQRRSEIVRQALVAREFFHRDRQYVIQDGKIVIVDESTGRQMPQRTWRQGLHQAIEAKEGLSVSDPSETVARLSFQRFFRCFHHLGGMTGTAREAAREFWQIYRLPVVVIPTNRPCVRVEFPDRVFAQASAKWKAIVDEVQRIHESGQPILVGTRTVTASEHLGALLSERGLEFRILNAVRHKEEAAIVAMAGEPSRITIATNMAGRGTDIKLGSGVAERGGLHVLATERHESGRVDRQLFGRAARQGDPGSAQAFVSLEDDLIRRYLPSAATEFLAKATRRAHGRSSLMARSGFAIAQRNAEAHAYKRRKSVLRADAWLDERLSFASHDAV